MKAPEVTWLVPEPRYSRLRGWLGQPPWHPDASMGSVWIRSFQMAPHLRALGYQTACNHINPLPQVAIFLRRYTATDIELAKYLKQRGVKIVVDVIVNYFEIGDQKHPPSKTHAYQDKVDTFKRLVDLADQVWTVSPFLCELSSHYHPNVHFVSDSVDPTHFTPSLRPANHYNQRPSNSPLLLGWSGVAHKIGPLDDLAPLLRPYLSSGQTRLLAITEKRPSLNVPHIYRRWRYATFPHYISTCDLCLAPRIVDDNYNRGHSLFKIGVFMAMGVPALAGPVPSYALLLEDGQAGAICHTLEGWKIHLDRYLTNPDLRHAAGNNAIEKMQPYLTPVIARHIDGLLQPLVCT
jgi:glycosyltransferase involved in cell wall biosynthesis